MPDNQDPNNLDTNLETKPWYLSKAIMASLATIIQGFLLIAFKLELTDQDMVMLTGILIGVGTVITGVLSLIGRVKARTAITLRKQPPTQ